MSAEIGNISVFRLSDIQLEEIPIGRGGYGTVYRGRHPELGIVAVKTLIDNGQLPQKHVRILQKEAQNLRQVGNHEGVLQVHGLIMERDNYSLVLEYMPLGNVAEFRKEFSVQYPIFVRITKEIISAMNYLHGQDPQVLHLDLKADNVLLTGLIHAKIADFGLTEWKTVTMTATRRTDAGSTGRRCTVSHVPPEVWSNINTPPDKYYDIYSFGICLWEMLSGKIPYGNATDDLVRSAVLSGQRPDFIQIPQACPSLLKQLMMRCWHQKLHQRPLFSVLKEEIDKGFVENFQKDTLTAMKNIRQEIKDNYPTIDLVYIATNEIDEISDAGTELANDQSHQQASQQSADSASATSQQEPMETAEESTSVEPVLFKDEKSLEVPEQQLRRILRDPIALRLARTPYIRDLFTVNDTIKEILDDDEKIKKYLDEDIMFKREILYPGNDFWGNLSGSHIALCRYQGRKWEQENEKELSSMVRNGQYGHSDSLARRMSETPRTKRRKRVENTLYNHPFIEELKKEGKYHRVKKALQNPEQLEQLLRDHDEAEDSRSLSLRLTTLDPEVIELAQDPVTLVAVLHQEYEVNREIYKKNPQLVMKLLARARRKYGLPGGGFKPFGYKSSSSSSSNKKPFLERDSMRDIEEPRMRGMMRRGFDDSDDDDSDDDMLRDREGMLRNMKDTKNQLMMEKFLKHEMGMKNPASMMERDEDIFFNLSSRMASRSRAEEMGGRLKGMMHSLGMGLFGENELRRKARIDAENKEFMKKYEAERREKAKFKAAAQFSENTSSSTSVTSTTAISTTPSSKTVITSSVTRSDSSSTVGSSSVTGSSKAYTTVSTSVTGSSPSSTVSSSSVTGSGPSSTVSSSVTGSSPSSTVSSSSVTGSSPSSTVSSSSVTGLGPSSTVSSSSVTGLGPSSTVSSSSVTGSGPSSTVSSLTVSKSASTASTSKSPATVPQPASTVGSSSVTRLSQKSVSGTGQTSASKITPVPGSSQVSAIDASSATGPGQASSKSTCDMKTTTSRDMQIDMSTSYQSSSSSDTVTRPIVGTGSVVIPSGSSSEKALKKEPFIKTETRLSNTDVTKTQTTDIQKIDQSKEEVNDPDETSLKRVARNMNSDRPDSRMSATDMEPDNLPSMESHEASYSDNPFTTLLSNPKTNENTSQRSSVMEVDVSPPGVTPKQTYRSRVYSESLMSKVCSGEMSSSKMSSVPSDAKKLKISDLETDAKPSEEPFSEKVPSKQRSGVITHRHADGSQTTVTLASGRRIPNLQVGSHNTMIVGGGGSDMRDDFTPQKPKKSKRNSKKIEAPSRDVTDNDCDIIAENLGKDFRRLFRELGFGKSQIEQIQMDYKDEGVFEVNYQLLRKWKKLGQATLAKLFEALQIVERDDIIQLIPK